MAAQQISIPTSHFSSAHTFPTNVFIFLRHILDFSVTLSTSPNCKLWEQLSDKYFLKKCVKEKISAQTENLWNLCLVSIQATYE